jgi:hypothetical protein
MTSVDLKPQKLTRSGDVFASLRGERRAPESTPEPPVKVVAPVETMEAPIGPPIAEKAESVSLRFARVPWRGKEPEQETAVESNGFSARDRFRFVPWDPSRIVESAGVETISETEAQELAIAYASQHSVRAMFAKMK